MIYHSSILFNTLFPPPIMYSILRDIYIKEANFMK
jgi:hypothetical protein